MRAVLILLCALVGAASVAQPVPLDSLLVGPGVEPTPQEVAAAEAALHQIEATSLQAVTCPEPGEAAPLSQAEMQVLTDRLGTNPNLPRLGVGAHVMDALARSQEYEASTAAMLPTCFSLSPADPGALLILQFWAALGWNLEFSRLAVEAGVLVPLVVVMVSVTAGVFSGQHESSYLYFRPEIAYPIALSALFYLTVAAGLQAQRQSSNGSSSWDVGPAAMARIAYLAGTIHPIVALSLVYLYETLILTPSVGVSYPIR